MRNMAVRMQSVIGRHGNMLIMSIKRHVLITAKSEDSRKI